MNLLFFFAKIRVSHFFSLIDSISHSLLLLKMGNIGFTKEHFDVEKYTFPYLRDVNYPSDREKSPYDELEGFPNGRKERGKILL